jgi:F0F1-type ATP synthase membrane subunit b/b'
MSDQSHLSVDGVEGDQFEREMRGYNRREVDETFARLRLHLRSLEDGKHDLEDRLSRGLDEIERLKLELSAARSSGRPAHEEISERIGQILKLADDEAKSQRNRAEEEIAKLRADAQGETAKLRADAKAETDRSRAEAHEQAERMLSAAQEQAETTVANAKTEAEATRKSAAADAQRAVGEATKQAESAVASAKAQAKQQLDEATARASAIHDGAERRLNLLMSRHTEAIRRLTEIRDVVTTVVAGEADRGSLEEEVARTVAGAMATPEPKSQPAGRAAAAAEGRHASAQGQPDAHGAVAAHRPAPPTSQVAAAAGPAGAGNLAARQAPGNGQHAGPESVRSTAVQSALAPEGDDTADGIKAVRE